MSALTIAASLVKVTRAVTVSVAWGGVAAGFMLLSATLRGTPVEPSVLATAAGAVVACGAFLLQSRMRSDSMQELSNELNDLETMRALGQLRPDEYERYRGSMLDQRLGASNPLTPIPLAP